MDEVHESASHLNHESASHLIHETMNPLDEVHETMNPLAPDLQLIPEFITIDEEQAIVQNLISSRFNASAPCFTLAPNRQIVRFGTFQPYQSGHLEQLIPDELSLLQSRIVDQHIMSSFPRSLTLNMYPPGSIIHPHIDEATYTGNEIGVLGLCSNSSLIFRKVKNGVIDQTSTGKTETVLLPARALLIMRNEKRYQWTHETPPLKTFRASVVFRPEKHCVASENTKLSSENK